MKRGNRKLRIRFFETKRGFSPHQGAWITSEACIGMPKRFVPLMPNFPTAFAHVVKHPGIILKSEALESKCLTKALDFQVPQWRPSFQPPTPNHASHQEHPRQQRDDLVA